MKRNIIIIISVLLLISLILFFIIYNHEITLANTKKNNDEYEKYTIENIQGTQLITIINKAIDRNDKNSIEKNENGLYIDNQENSIKIEIKFKEREDRIPMEVIVKVGIENFVKFYSESEFHCINKEYHNTTKNISYLLFEEV